MNTDSNKTILFTFFSLEGGLLFQHVKNSTRNTYFQGEVRLVEVRLVEVRLVRLTGDRFPLRKNSSGNDPVILKTALHGERDSEGIRKQQLKNLKALSIKGLLIFKYEFWPCLPDYL